MQTHNNESQKGKHELMDKEPNPIMITKIEHPHKCKPVARATNMAEGRDWWVGELTEEIEEYPHEKYCLHLKTPLKEVVFLCNMADFEHLTVLCNAITGKINDRWLESVTKAAKKLANKSNLEDNG